MIHNKKIIFLLPLLLILSSCTIASFSPRIGSNIKPYCEITPGVSCENYSVFNEDRSVNLYLRNNFGEDINDVTVKITPINRTNNLCELQCVNGCVNHAMLDGILTTWSATNCSKIGSVGDRFSTNIVFTYITDSGLVHTKIGILETIISSNQNN